MKKRFVLTIVIVLLIISGCQSQSHTEVEDTGLTVAVSITPEATFVKEVAGDNVDVITMVPSGSSPENYQPTPKQMTQLSDADIYFAMGVPADDINILPNISQYNEEIEVVRLDEIVAEVYPERELEEHDHEHEEELEEEEEHEYSRDPHIWLSPKRVIVMVEAIRDELSKIDPKNSSVYAHNAESYISELEELDRTLSDVLNECENKTFLIYHPSYGYFAEDYGLNMVSIEEDGKQPSAKQVADVIDIAKEENIKIIFYQEEFDDEQAKAIAEEINGVTVKVSPLGADYIENLEYIADKIASAEG